LNVDLGLVIAFVAVGGGSHLTGIGVIGGAGVGGRVVLVGACGVFSVAAAGSVAAAALAARPFVHVGRQTSTAI
jgi:hypothetical protein